MFVLVPVLALELELGRLSRRNPGASRWLVEFEFEGEDEHEHEP